MLDQGQRLEGMPGELLVQLVIIQLQLLMGKL
jgi:hypothetical protein|uniref:Uncharacterized protein n=1 Tax=Picea glauca TaxID=3330 RepID=A0A117NHV7_PICGL|nr:hypothetical protein ABT39_MTgene4333 [Picea glauca]QHR88460.1 hypothetical protein Q903MT_gene2473 [Picea sitchensis]